MKQQQTGSVRDYKLQFKQLLSTMGRLSALHQLGCFVSGLKGTLRTEVKAGRPKSVTEAIWLVRLYETRNWSLKKPPIPDEWRSDSKDLEPLFPSPNLPHTRTPTRRLSTTEMQERRARGLCFNCDKKFVVRHRCKKYFVMDGVYIAEDEGGEEDPFDAKGLCGEEPIISLHALTGTLNPQTMRVRSALGKLGVIRLMDSGSTHNFFNPQ
jgi:hypothetical protein